jgi:hypothetical protein
MIQIMQYVSWVKQRQPTEKFINHLLHYNL